MSLTPAMRSETTVPIGLYSYGLCSYGRCSYIFDTGDAERDDGSNRAVGIKHSDGVDDGRLLVRPRLDRAFDCSSRLRQDPELHVRLARGFEAQVEAFQPLQTWCVTEERAATALGDVADDELLVSWSIYSIMVCI